MVALGVGVWTLGVGFLLSLCVKFFARPLRYLDGLVISLIAAFVMAVLMALYYASKAMTGLPNAVDGVATLMGMIVMGILITRQAQTYGVVKTGKLGVGGKSILGLIGISWLLIGLYILVAALSQ